MYRGSPDSTNFVLPGNRTIEKSNLERTSSKNIRCTFRKAVFQEKKGKKKHTLSGNSYYLVRF